ncbi:MAG: ribonuclease HII, partial [Candidatus Cloacimonetes bacterium]|nr:ribonuclease HII [Candidatus Cloacimonadota bacterium]
GKDIPPTIPGRAVVKGDSRQACIAAASVLAKVYRDRLMIEMDKLYPEYSFAQHKGYGTKAHYAALNSFGACKEHRKTFRLH